MVAGDCRGSHNLHILPVPINSQTSYWSGPILSAITLSINIHTGRIGAISDQFALGTDRKSTRLNSSHDQISYAVFCLKKKKQKLTSNGAVSRLALSVTRTRTFSET